MAVQDFPTLPTYFTLLRDSAKSIEVSLENRQQIQIKCELACQDFRFTTNDAQLMKQTLKIYILIKWVGIVTLVSTIIYGFLIAIVFNQGLRKTSQKFYVVLYLFCIVSTVATLYLLHNMHTKILHQEKKYHRTLKTILTQNCFLDKGWEKVLKDWS